MNKGLMRNNDAAGNMCLSLMCGEATSSTASTSERAELTPLMGENAYDAGTHFTPIWAGSSQLASNLSTSMG